MLVRAEAIWGLPCSETRLAVLPSSAPICVARPAILPTARVTCLPAEASWPSSASNVALRSRPRPVVSSFIWPLMPEPNERILMAEFATCSREMAVLM